jgi:uncharacterized protein YrrD
MKPGCQVYRRHLFDHCCRASIVRSCDRKEAVNMKIVDGANVLTAQNKKVGRVDRVVLDPETKRVTHIVVRKGILLTEDKLIPIEAIDRVEDQQIFLNKDVGEVEDFPEFEQTHYFLAEEIDEMEDKGDVQTLNAKPVYWYPTFGLSGAGQNIFAPRPVYYAATQRNIPKDTVPLRKGARVLSSDGKHIGNIEEVLVDPEMGCATHFVVEEGLLFPDKKLIPATWLTLVQENEVHLALDASTLETLPEYKG